MDPFTASRTAQALNNTYVQSPMQTLQAGHILIILTGSTDRNINLYNSSTGRLVQAYTAGHSHAVLSLSVGPSNAIFASAGGDRHVCIWDVATGHTVRRFSGHGGQVNAVAMGGDGGESVVVSGSVDASVRVWDLRNRSSSREVMKLDEARDAVGALEVRGAEILAGSTDGRVRAYDLRMGVVRTDCLGAPVTSLQTTRDGSAYLSSTLDSHLRLMDKATGSLLQSFAHPSFTNEKYRIRSCLGLTDAVVVSGSEAPSDATLETLEGDRAAGIFVWDVLDGKVLMRLSAGDSDGGGENAAKGLRANKAVVSAVVFSTVRKEWCSANHDGTVTLWGLP
ncbi:MAG: hypothetical protein M1819_006903 [Sarea resinae]|nr:MAG: hypothetical protein M1819_006903 [Sarea resinae]